MELKKKNGFLRIFQGSKGVLMEQNKEPALSREIRLLSSTARRQEIPDWEPVTGPEEIDGDEIIRVARMARIVDERDGLPLYKKLTVCRKAGMDIQVDAVDDEPYISSQLGPLLHMKQACAGGMRLAQKATGAQEVTILVYRNIADLELRIPRTVEGFQVRKIGGVYPAEIRPDGPYTENEGRKTMLIGACALIHLYRAVCEGILQTTVFITVSGNCVAGPCNLEVSMGMTVTDVLDRCGLSENPTRIVVGGSMTGESVEDTDQTRITATTRAVLAFREDERDKQYLCISCGLCAEACPADLNPMLIYRAMEMGRGDLLQNMDYQNCIECMCCSYRCPAKLNLAAAISSLKRKKGETS